METGKIFYCAAGFREDVIEVLSRFKSLDSHTFQDFAEIWRDIKFFRVFIGRSTRSELMEFCEEALGISKELLLSSKHLTEKIGGLFMLYSLYFSMPLKGPKIRIIMSEWESLIVFKKYLVDAKRWDCIMVLNKLVDGNAFAHCLCDNERGLENYYVLKDFMKGNSRPIESHKKKAEILSIFDNIVKEASNYSNLKANLSYKLGVNASRVPTLFTEDTLKEIAETVKNLNDLVKEKSKNSENTRRSQRGYPPTQKAEEDQDSEPDYHQDSDSNEDDPEYPPGSPESIDTTDVDANVDGDEDETRLAKKTKSEESQVNKFEVLNFRDTEIPSTSKSHDINNDFDYLPHIKMEKTHYDSDSSDFSHLDDFQL